MEIKKLECPSCGAPLEWNASSCNFCKTEIRYFENNSAALPTNLTTADIESNIILHEKDFLSAILIAMSAPYSKFKTLKDQLPNEQAIKNDLFKPGQNFTPLLKMLYDTFFILPTENIVEFEVVRDNGDHSEFALLTSLRLFIVDTNSMLAIPLEKFKSWQGEKPLSGKRVLGTDGESYTGQPVLRYFLGEKEKEIRFNANDRYISEEIVLSVITCKEWEDLNPLQKNLLTVSRYSIYKSYKIQVKPLELMEYIPQKKGCFVATATLGDYNHPIVIQLQDFRDSYLINKTWGKTFVKWYYKNGPFLASLISKSYLLKKLSYWLLIRPLFHISKLVKYF